MKRIRFKLTEPNDQYHYLIIRTSDNEVLVRVTNDVLAPLVTGYITSQPALFLFALEDIPEKYSITEWKITVRQIVEKFVNKDLTIELI